LTEVLEYCLVVMASALFVAGSVATYDSFSAFSAGLQFRVGSAAVVRLATEAVSDGNSTGLATVPATTITCAEGLLTMVSNGASITQGIPGACSFSLTIPAGTHTFEFSNAGKQLSLVVT
jgi:hypothetical protein